TDHPHVHIVLRGRADDGENLVIARNYITHGFRGRAEELATLELGQRRDLDIASARMRETAQERFTSIDRELKELAS
ncbi:MAG TPA: type VI secretion protein, partial [Parvularcula sp.]|nr:type VI secretion protein [Parvularcula sp.]